MQTITNLPTYVFASVSNGRLAKVVEELKQNNQIDLIAPVTGRFDLALRLKQSAPEHVLRTLEKIRTINGIRTTTTHTAFEGFQPNKRLEAQTALGISLMNVEHQPIGDAIKQLSSVPGIVEAWAAVPGQFDIVALWQARTVEDLMKTFIERLPNLEGSFRSETLLAHIPFYRA